MTEIGAVVQSIVNERPKLCTPIVAPLVRCVVIVIAYGDEASKAKSDELIVKEVPEP